MFRLLLASILLLCCQTAQAIVVSITTPQDGQSYTAPATFTVASSAEPTEDGERVRSHQIYRNGEQIASGTTGSLSVTVSNLPAGNYWFSSRATNNLDRTVQSIPHEVTVVVPGGFPPTVSMGAPTGAPFIAPATVGLSATAADSDGTIIKVQFFANGGLIGTDTAAPYQMSWSNVAVGTHSIVAKATDNNNITTTSSAVSVTVVASIAKGVIDGVSSDGAGGYVLTGWACSTGRNESIRVHVYAGGPAGTGAGFADVLADQPSEAALAAACYAQGTHYRFRIPLTDAIRQQHANKAIYVHGIGGGGNPLLQRSGVFSIPAPLSLKRTYTYDAHQRLCKSVEPETGATLYGYDAAGNLAWSAAGLPAATACDAEGDPPAIQARSVLRDYDARNRLKELSFPDGRGDQTWEYTPDGLAQRIVTDNGDGNVVTNQYVYNKRRLMTRETLVWGIVNWPIGYGYNANGHLHLQDWHGLLINYAPNALGQPTQAGPYATGVSYHPNGAIAQFTYGNGIIHQLTQNVRGLPDRSLDIYQHTHYLDDGYDYDQNGNVAAISDGRDASHRGNRTMTYDDLDRLKTTVSPMFGTATYGYDGLDNLTRVTVGSTAARDHYYCYDAAWRLSNVKTGSCGGTTVVGLGYDLQGNLANKNGILYGFDFGNRLRSVSTSPTSKYLYDGHGRRVWDFTSNDKYSHYNHAGQLTMTADERTGKVAEYIHLNGSLVAIRERDIPTNTYTTKYQHTDALGSPVAVTDQSRAVIERNEYEPYGKVVNHALKDGPGYTGHVADAATGLNYMQQRYYDPGIGRFLSVDPVSADSDTGALFNRYMYAANNPYRFIDPDGRCTGSRIENDDGTCRSTGEHTTQGTSASSGSPSTANGRYSSGAIYTSRAAASEAASQHQTDLAGGTWQKLLFGSGHLTFLYEEGDSFGYGLVPYYGGIAPAFGGVGGASSSRLLGRSLQGAGFFKPVGSAAHHIVAGNARGASAARAALQRFGIGINDASNGVYLPIAAHRSLHTNAYYNAVNSALGQATTRQEAVQVLQAIRQGLASGTFP